MVLECLKSLLFPTALAAIYLLTPVTGFAVVSPTLQSLPKSSSSSSLSSSSLCAIKEATFGMGCFWKPSEELLKVDGVVNTVVGYTGHPSAKEAPTYEKVCFSRDWVEGVRVQYDDTKLSYPQLLDAFFETQEPKIGSRQYASIIFVQDKEQEQIAQQWLQSKTQSKAVRSRDGIPAAFTQIEPASDFYMAERYHQQYWQKTRPRIATMIALLAISSGILDNVTPIDWQSTIHTGCNAIVFAALFYVLIERKIDTKTVKLE